MKAVVAVDSFKGSMTSMQAGNAVKRGILSACPDAEVVVCPVADGGEGTTDALIEGLGGEKISLTVTGPYGDFVSCYYGWLSKQKTAVMEGIRSRDYTGKGKKSASCIYARGGRNDCGRA